MLESMDLVRGQQQYPAPYSDFSTTAALSTRYTMASKPQSQQQPLRVVKTARMGHFDPDELTRRLYIVLADQKEHAERKRRARLTRDGAQQQHQHQPRQNQPRQVEGIWRKDKYPEKGPVVTSTTAAAVTSAPALGGGGGSMSEQRSARPDRRKAEKASVEETPALQTEYCHVPREAAKQFVNTTTVEVIRSQPTPAAHKQSKRASRFHLRNKDEENGGGNGDAGEPAHRKLQQDQCQDLRERMLQLQRAQREREHEHNDAAMAAATRNRHTFGAELARLVPGGQNYNYNMQRNSTGNTAVAAPVEDNRRSMLATMDRLGDVSEETTPPTEEPVPHHDPADHRVDWTQSDESKARPKLLLTPFLRKADSLWGLRGKLSSRDKTGSGDQGSQRQTSLKSPKSGFLAKFVSKR